MRAQAPARRVLLTGWFSFLHGEATAGDVLAAEAVGGALDDAGIPYDTAWSPGFRPGALHLETADPAAYADVITVLLNAPEVLYAVEHGAEPVRGRRASTS